MSNDNTPPEPSVPEGTRLHPEFGDWPRLLNMCNRLMRICEANGAEMTGGGCGMGQADIDIEIEGHAYNVCIRPLPRDD